MKFCRGRLFDHVHLVVANLESSRRFYGAAIGSLGLPIQIVERKYHPGYYAAYVLDPDGNNVEAVFHGPVERSADAVILTPIGQPHGGGDE